MLICLMMEAVKDIPYIAAGPLKSCHAISSQSPAHRV
jgi:hypothetical protein